MRHPLFAITLVGLSLTATGLQACGDTTTLIASWDPAGPSGSAASGGTGGALPDASLGGFGGGSALPVFGLSFEAEDGSLSGDWAVDEAPSGEIFLSAQSPSAEGSAPGDARATYLFRVEAPGDYVIWGRIHSPGAAENRFWFRVDDGPWILWRISTGEEWYWDDLHDNTDFGQPVVLSFTPGVHRLDLASAVVGAELDKLVVTEASASAPAQTVICNPPHSVLLHEQCVPSCGSYGNVSCTPTECTGRDEVVAYDCAICCLLEGASE